MMLTMHSLAVFAGVDLFALKFYLDRVVPPFPSTILGTRKLQALGYSTVKTASFCISSC